MADAPQLSRPGVEVVQEFRTVSPTILVPSLPACVVGVANQVVEGVDDTGALVSDALAPRAAQLLGSFVSSPFTLTGLGGETIDISVNNGVPVTVTFAAVDPSVTEAADQINEAAIPGLLAVVETSGTQQRLVLRTTAVGDNASLAVVGGVNGAAAAGFDLGYKDRGLGGYNNLRKYDLQLANYPDPRGNLAELSVDYDSVRVFISTGGGNFREALRTQGLRRYATAAVSTVDDGDGDNLTPILEFAGSPAFTSGANAGAASHTGSANISTLNYGTTFATPLTLTYSVDGGPLQTLTIDGTVITTDVQLVAAINAITPGVAAEVGSNLVLTSPTTGGLDSTIYISADSTALVALGLTAGIYEGSVTDPGVGDDVYVDGVLVGSIVEVVATNQLRLDSEVNLSSFSGARYSIVATGLDNQAASVSNPASELIVDEDSGTITVKQHLFREVDNTASDVKGFNVYVAYNALRVDVSAEAEEASLLRIGSVADLEDQLAPLDTQNPLGLGMFFAIQNAPGIEVAGLGIGAASATAPYGTISAWTKAFEYLESKDVYAIAPLTHDETVAQLGDAHASAMSEPDIGLERCVFFNPARPSRQADTLVASGATANAAAAGDSIDTGLANLPALVAAAGLGPGPYTLSDNLFLELEGDTNKYLVESISGSSVTINDGPIAQTDAFYSDAAGGDVFSSAIVDRPFSIKVRGAALANLTEEAVAYAAIPQGFQNRRMVVTAPDKVRATIDGLEQSIEGFYMNAALAGLTSSKNPQDPMTEVGLTGFTGVVGSNDRYSEVQLRIMSGGGLWIMYQAAAGQPIKTRQQLTTDMSSVEKREFSILNQLDFTAKFIRGVLRNFIGRFNLTTNVIDSVSVTLDGAGRFLVDQGVLGAFTVNSIQQDADDPSRMLIDVTVTVLYPLNKIKITLVV